jgi:ribonuclease HI
VEEKPILMRNPKGIKDIKIFTDDSKKAEKVGCVVITPDQNFRKRLKPQNTVYSAEQEAIIKAIYVTQRTGERRLIIMDSLSTLMAVEGEIN